MHNYKNTHFNHPRAVLELFLKGGEARLYKLFKFVRFGASTQVDNAFLEREFLESSSFERLRVAVSSRIKG